MYVGIEIMMFRICRETTTHPKQNILICKPLEKQYILLFGGINTSRHRGLNKNSLIRERKFIEGLKNSPNYNIDI